jgi:HAD superfamily hydrolase (TIGR01484 family)
MQALTFWPAQERRRIIGVLTDIDDTLTTEGAITPDALRALGALRGAGLHVIPVTGRPVGWSVPFARNWPVDAIVAENGAVALVDAGVRKIYQQDAATRAANYAQLQNVARQVLREVPGATLAQDSPGRETDIAIDHSEFAHLPQAAIDQVVATMRREGLQATVSSIHINGWIGAHDKLAGARWIVRELFGRELDAELARWVYVGDSTNDQLMFEHFPHSVGVANIRRFEAQLTHPPRYITQGERGAGFAEVAQAILTARTR